MEIKTRGEFLYLEYVKDGKRIRKSTKLKNTKSNIAYIYRNIIPELERKLEHGVDISEYKLSYFTDKILAKTKENLKAATYRTYEVGVKNFFEIVGDKPIDKYSVMDIEKFIDRIKGASASRVYLAPISLAFNLALKHEIIPRNPCLYADKPKLNPKPKEPFTMEQVHKILEASDGELKRFLYFAFYTGARAGEILGLTWGDISNAKISIKRTKLSFGGFNSPKNGKERSVYLLAPLREYLATQKRGGKDAELFVTTQQNIRKLFINLLKRLGLKPQGLHVTRHTYASLLMSANIKPVLVQEMLGHSSLTMTSHYVRFLEQKNDALELEKALG
ncbi:tyrosine-type recombinase/integrase [Campylobacter californiensis]|uniref:tyrosine-type recombinase/integrase n=1 Tax=Campylobacter californiensis TaxID=1032243 RepID=UPI0014731833|nr:site-specific integrase [Campylobacter sp. RM12916]MBE3610537.1 tyrosine-type recombinase/integrase [Campylobacter sp. RM12916]